VWALWKGQKEATVPILPTKKSRGENDCGGEGEIQVEEDWASQGEARRYRVGEAQKNYEEEQVMFKPCAGCKTKMKCKKAGKCLGKMKAKPRRRK